MSLPQYSIASADFRRGANPIRLVADFRPPPRRGRKETPIPASTLSPSSQTPVATGSDADPLGVAGGKIWAANFCRYVLEVIEGARPLTQLSRWIRPDLYRALQLRLSWEGALGARRIGPVRVLRVRSRACGEGAQEASVVSHDGKNARAAALRIEAFRGRWMVTRLEIA